MNIHGMKNFPLPKRESKYPHRSAPPPYLSKNALKRFAAATGKRILKKFKYDRPLVGRKRRETIELGRKLDRSLIEMFTLLGIVVLIERITLFVDPVSDKLGGAILAACGEMGLQKFFGLVEMITDLRVKLVHNERVFRRECGEARRYEIRREARTLRAYGSGHFVKLEPVGPGEHEAARADELTLPFDNLKLGLRAAFKGELIIRDLLLDDYGSYGKTVEINSDVGITLEIKRKLRRQRLNGLARVEKAVAIGRLERFVADNAYALDANVSKTIQQPNTTNAKRIAVVGSGPAGLAFAGDMAKLGYTVTVFEALHEIGGVLKYGIPEFRLPNSVVDQEIEGLRQLGVDFKTDVIIGKTLTIDDLKAEGYQGIFVGSGAGLPRFMGIPGENLNGVLSCNEYLTRVNLMDASSEESDTPVLRAKNVAVIGGGNTAMDAVRTAKRLGAERAMIIYRRSEEEMPARIEEVRHAKEEGIEFLTLHNPIEYHADENGRVKEAVLQVMTLGEPDESGRRSPVALEGQTITIPVDEVIVSVGVSPNPLIPSTVAGLEISKRGTIVVGDNMQSSIPTLFAGGDIVRGGATVILAMSDGRKAAQSMHEYLSTVNN